MPIFHFDGADFRTLNVVDPVTGPSKDSPRVLLPTECGCSFGRSPHSILHEVPMPRKKTPEAIELREEEKRREEGVPAALMVRRMS